MKKELPKIYEPQKVEDKIYQLWEKSGLFNPDNIKSNEKYCNILPPPNANGELHLGHASGYAVMDILGRFERMNGKKVLLLPGKDHAGILSQVVYEQILQKERGITRQQLGREKFYQEVYDFCTKISDYMREQEKKIGISADWSREKFTLDPEISKTVLDTFVKMYEDGLIYKGKRIISWCPRCGSALSDLEVKYREREGKLYYIKYPLENSEGFVTVATTRPETMLGDSAVAVNPEDKRYKNLVGKNAVLPLLKRIIPIIADKRVDKEFGTGAVKVTPAHDPVDWEIGKDHKLPEIQVIDEKAVITPLGGPYEGLGVREARVKITEDLRKEKLLEKIETIKHSVSECERCRSVIEPLISDQWFINVDHKKYSLKKESLKTIKSGKIKIYPKSFEKILTGWFSNLHDWCISRQIWWGHRFPVWYKKNNQRPTTNPLRQVENEASDQRQSGIYIGVKPPKVSDWIQDENTFDTWFSSGQWAFTALGYPQGKDYKNFYPSDMMVMGRDILFFWAARMIMISLYRTGKAPFKNLYFTGLVRDKYGHKMSKSRGNGIDPLEMVKKFGSDALRLSLITDTTPGLDIRVYEEKIESFRNFANKLWNISRYCLGSNANFQLRKNIKKSDIKTATDYWIVTQLEKTIEEINSLFQAKQISLAADKLKIFTWNTFADWYVEIHKVEKNNKILEFALDKILKLWHPFAPHVTEEIFQAAGNTGKLLMMSPWPKFEKKLTSEKAAINFERIISLIKQIRNVRSVYRIEPAKKINISIVSRNRKFVQNQQAIIKRLASAEKIQIIPRDFKLKNCARVTADRMKVYVHLKGIIDIQKEKGRIKKDMENLESYRASLKNKLKNKNFLSKAPEEIINQEKNNFQKTGERLREIKKYLANLK